MNARGSNLRYLFAFLSIVVFSSCGSDPDEGGGQDPLPAGVAARVEIVPGAVLLTQRGQSKSLTVRVFDADGVEIRSDVQWESTRPGQVSVDAAGVLTATGDGGTSQIVAKVGDVRSQALLAVHTDVPDATILLTDANIVGDPLETDPDAQPSFSNSYRVELTGVAVNVGDLLVNTEGKAVAGRVTAVAAKDGNQLATLALPTIREIFPELDIDEEFDLNQAEVTFPEELLAIYDVTREGDSFSFVPKPDTEVVNQELRRGALTPMGTFALPPFASCTKSLTGVGDNAPLPLTLGVPPLFKVALNNRLEVLYTKATGLERFVVHGEPSFAVELGLKATAAFEGKVTCEAELLIVRIPVGGPLSLFIGGLMPIGVGAELGGKVTIATFGVSAKAEAKTTVDIGIACPGGVDCQLVKQFGPLATAFTPALDAPGIQDLRLEPTLSTYGFVKASIGNPFLKKLRFSALQVKAGLTLAANFAPRGTQISDAAYASDYKLSTELKAGAGDELGEVAKMLGLANLVSTELAIAADIATSPTGTVTADKATFVDGDTVHFTVKLDPTKVGFLPEVGPYNVKRVVLVRNTDPITPLEVVSVDAQQGQTEFTIPFVATDSGSVAEFYAFVVTTLVPADFFSLEIGKATSSQPVALENLRQTIGLGDRIEGPTDFTVLVEAADNTGVFRPVADAVVTVSYGPDCVIMSADEATTDAAGIAAFTVEPTAKCLENSFTFMATVPNTALSVTSPLLRSMLIFPVFEGDLFVDAIALPFTQHLTGITGNLTITTSATGTPTSFSMPNLTTVGGALDIDTRSAFLEVLLPALESVGGSVFIGIGAVSGTSHPQLVRLQLPALAQAQSVDIRSLGPTQEVTIGPVKTTGDFNVFNNAFANFDGFSAGIEVGRFLQIANNTGFSNATATAFANTVNVVSAPRISGNTGP